jgi:uncharacterized protein (TIGR00251 family)
MHYQWQGHDLLLHCQLQPRASRNEIVGTIKSTNNKGSNGDRLKICITSPPVDGKANKHLIAITAKWFGTSKTRIKIIRGETGRQKTLLIEQPSQLPAEAKISPAGER